MRISQAGEDDLAAVAGLVWLHAADEEQSRQPLDAFTDALGGWWAVHRASHHAFVARVDGPELVGVAWLALLPRVPRPGTLQRVSGDIQSVFVLPEHRGEGIGTALVRAAAEHAAEVGATRVTVHSSSRAVPVYERLGFAAYPRFLQLSREEAAR